MGALFEDDDRVAGLGELARGHGTTGAGADDHDVAFEGLARGDGAEGVAALAHVARDVVELGAAVGVYGVMALVVGERTREVGVRLALGAQPGTVLRMVLGQATRLALAGVVAGLVAAGLLSPLLEHQLFGIRPYDPVTFTAVPALLLLVAAAAAYAPARRAMRIDPTEAIREQ